MISLEESNKSQFDKCIDNERKESADSNYCVQLVNKNKKDKVSLKYFTLMCNICMGGNICYIAVGRCNHSICEQCALRIRIQTNNKNCVVCKEHMEYMFVYRFDYNLLVIPEHNVSKQAAKKRAPTSLNAEVGP